MSNKMHEMKLVGTNSDGYDEWHCPICGRRLLLKSQPTLTKLVLAIGDMTAEHMGVRPGLSFTSRNALPEPTKPELPVWMEDFSERW
ncbi:MAG: hypothetical protein HXX08_11150 [Chloroflexi bacterium]|uniref:Uncharacterized protein n=1 Tax=Candidatus Chlorohelix allophototropha TaxID=3003348 RepID=A0A8T7M3M9_9CHLR|nr:hypothetical protein [Chloroflexota bacterium]WJW65793.1 hypothetical protein OZ401_001572 [Chloroflexota bacterium L227-S17]